MEHILAFVQKIGAPPIFSKAMMDRLAERPPLPSSAKFSSPFFTTARKNKSGRRMPQAIAHRGYKAQYPENTMGAFRGAVDVGVHAVETDVHLSKDGVVVLSHDATLQRCFGIDKKLIDCDWKYLSSLQTIREPRQPLPRLQDLLEFLAEPPNSSVWLLLDIKMDNNAQDIMRLMASTLAKVSPAPGTRWEDRIVLGCWAASYFPLCATHFPGFPVTHIGFSVPYARQFFSIPNVSFNMLQASLVSPSGRRFIRDAHTHNRQVYAWTVNDPKNMDWCIRNGGVDGVISDDPKKFLDLCDQWDPSSPPPAWPTKLLFNFIRINIFTWLFGMLFWFRHGWVSFEGANRMNGHKK